jgi:hypothetical protein
MIGILRRLFGRTTSDEGWSVRIKRRGRGGPIVYIEGAHAIEFDFELGNAGIIYCPSAERWDREFAWAVGRRREIIGRVADEFIRREFRGYGWSFAAGRDDVVLVAKPVP